MYIPLWPAATADGLAADDWLGSRVAAADWSKLAAFADDGFGLAAADWSEAAAATAGGSDSALLAPSDGPALLAKYLKRNFFVCSSNTADAKS